MAIIKLLKNEKGLLIKKEFIFIGSTFVLFYLCFVSFMPDALGLLSSLGWLNRFLFGDFGLFYPFTLLVLNFLFYKRAYKLENIKKSECVGLCIAYIAAMLLFAIFAKDAEKDAGYIPEVLYTIVGFVFGRMGTGFLSLVLLLGALVLVFPRFVELVFGVSVNLSVFEKLESKIKNAIGDFFGGKGSENGENSGHLDENATQENKSDEKRELSDESDFDESDSENDEFLGDEAKIQPENSKNAEFTQDEFTPNAEFSSQNEPKFSEASEPNLKEMPRVQPVKKQTPEFKENFAPKPKRTPDEIAAELANEFSQDEPFGTSPHKSLQEFIDKAEFEDDELAITPQKPIKPYVPEKFLKPRSGETSLNLDKPSVERSNKQIQKATKNETPFEVIEKSPEKKPASVDESDEFVPVVREVGEFDEFRGNFSSSAAIKTEVAENTALLNTLEKGKLEVPKDFKLPPLDFLVLPSASNTEINEQEIDKKIYDLLEKLRRFKIGGDVISTYTGPVVTTFEFRPSADVKVSRILSLQDDLAMALRATSIRIQAPIPGKDVVGIEVPNDQIQTIYLREILESEIFKNAKSPLTIALGKDIVGNAFVTDLKKLPHLLIAGTTGSGKSVGINAMLLSLLYRNSPKNLRLMMIDPKMLEFSIYNDIPHLLTPVITDPKKAIIALSNMVAEMERRYKLMAEARTKNIENYNEKCAELDAEPLPFIVVIIDELADLMMTAGKDVEFYIGRLAQMARASGIHLIVATQRPSVDVVTGLIKANLPSRLAYKVGQRIDSKVILDAQGAESLLGRGDSLFTPPGTSNLVRLHAPFASEMEIEKIVEFLKAQQAVEYDENFLKDSSNGTNGGAVGGSGISGGENFGEEGLDELIEQAKAVILEDKKTSISYLQRRLKIGYNRAANIIEQLAQMGVLSEPDAKGQREIL